MARPEDVHPGAPPLEGLPDAPLGGPPEGPVFEAPGLETAPVAAYFPPAGFADLPDLAREATPAPPAIEPLPLTDALEALEVPAPGVEPETKPAASRSPVVPAPPPQAIAPEPRVAPAQPQPAPVQPQIAPRRMWQPPRPPSADDRQIQRPYPPGAGRGASSGLGLGIVALVVLFFTAGAFFFISLPLAISSWATAARAVREAPDPRLTSIPRGAVRLAQVTVALSLVAAALWIVAIAGSA